MKAEILNHAILQLKTGGYDALNFGKIAEGLGISRPNVHHHFQNKESLALEATKAYIQQKFARIEDLAKQHPSDFNGFLKDLEFALKEMVKTCHQEGGCICAQLVKDPEIPDELAQLSRAHFNDILGLFKDLIIASQEAGSLDASINPEHLATQKLTIIQGIAQMALASTDLEAYSESISGILS